MLCGSGWMASRCAVRRDVGVKAGSTTTWWRARPRTQEIIVVPYWETWRLERAAQLRRDSGCDGSLGGTQIMI